MSTSKGKTHGKGSKVEWKPGAKVSVGGRDYVVLRREDHLKGKPWVIQTPDGSRTYQWRAFHGLTLTSGQPLVRPRRQEPKAAATPPATAAGQSGLLAIIVEDIQENPRKGAGRFLAKVMAHLGIDMGDSEERRADGEAKAGS